MAFQSRVQRGALTSGRGPGTTRNLQPSRKSGTLHQRPDSFERLSPGPHEATPISTRDLSIPIPFTAQSTSACKLAPWGMKETSLGPHWDQSGPGTPDWGFSSLAAVLGQPELILMDLSAFGEFEGWVFLRHMSSLPSSSSAALYHHILEEGPQNFSFPGFSPPAWEKKTPWQ